jgi:hypothetical protein
MRRYTRPDAQGQVASDERRGQPICWLRRSTARDLQFIPATLGFDQAEASQFHGRALTQSLA